MKLNVKLRLRWYNIESRVKDTALGTYLDLASPEAPPCRAVFVSDTNFQLEVHTLCSSTITIRFFLFSF